MEKSLVEKFYDAFIKFDRWELYLKGLKTTLIVALIAIIIGIVIGVVVAMVNYVNKKTGKLKVLNFITKIYVTVIRGTPVVLQMFIMFTVIFITQLGDLKIGSVVWEGGADYLIGGLTFGLNSGAYVAEIIRAGFESVDDGQMEAGRSLGLSMGQTVRAVITPQAIRNVLPPLFNEFIILVKETSVLGYVGVMDLGRVPSIITSITFETMPPLIIVACMYLVLVLILTGILKLLEKYLSKSDRNFKRVNVRGKSFISYLKEKFPALDKKNRIAQTAGDIAPVLSFKETSEGERQKEKMSADMSDKEFKGNGAVNEGEGEINTARSDNGNSGEEETK